MTDLKQLERLTRAFGVSGDEGEIRALIRREAEAYADESTVDPMGNLLVHRAGPGPKVLLAAHMDGVGVMVTHCEKEGVLRFAPVGGLDPATLLQVPVRFRNGVRGLISCDDNKLGKELKWADLFLDIGAKDKAEAETLVSPGDTAAYDAPFFRAGNRVVSPYLDDRAGCGALLAVLRALGERKNDLYFAFATQEEVGTRGAGPAGFAVRPDYAIVVDVTCPDDIPGALHEGTTALGKGAAVKVMDHSIICHLEVVERLLKLAEEKNIPAQRDVLTCGGTDGGPISRSRTGVKTGGVSIPCRYTHAPTELMDLDDFSACVELITAFCESEL